MLPAAPISTEERQSSRVSNDGDPEFEALLNQVAAERERLRQASEGLYRKALDLVSSSSDEFVSMPRDRGSSQTNALGALAPREVEVLSLIAEGYSTKQIAWQLKISFKTAVCYRTRLLKKLNVHETASLVRLAIRGGLTPALK